MRKSTALYLLLVFAFSTGLAVRAEPPTASVTGAQALAESALVGDLQQVRRLVEGGVPVDAPADRKRTALMWASFNGHTAVARYLLDQGANVNAKDADGRGALMYASSGPFAETVKLLLDRGAQVDLQGTAEGFTALMTAAAEGQLAVVQLLLARGANPSIRDEDGDTAASFARQKGHTEVVALLTGPPVGEGKR
jgi:ankyrin repeat protein